MTPHRLLPPQLGGNETREVITKRSWPVRTVNDVLAVIERLTREETVGNLRLNLGPGGKLGTLEFEERSKLPIKHST